MKVGGYHQSSIVIGQIIPGARTCHHQFVYQPQINYITDAKMSRLTVF